MAGFMSPTARTIACRCSTATVNTRRSGTTCTGPAASICTTRNTRFAISVNWGRSWGAAAAARRPADGGDDEVAAAAAAIAGRVEAAIAKLDRLLEKEAG